MLNLAGLHTPVNTGVFQDITRRIQDQKDFRVPIIWGIGCPVWTAGKHPELASYRFPKVNGPTDNLGALAILTAATFGGRQKAKGVVERFLDQRALAEILRMFTPFLEDGARHGNLEILQAAMTARRPFSFVAIYDDGEPEGIADSTLKLYGLSNRLYRPNTLNVKKIFTRLPTFAWMGDQPMNKEDVDEALLSAAISGKDFSPHMVDKFPLYIHRINALEMEVRITDQHKVRLGAYLGAGTTLMPGASYINFNAGTEGPAMVEGRISSGAFVGAGSDVGGGASMLGILSGGNDVPISVGRNCLLEVNSTLGIPLGDCCIVATETAVMAGTKVLVNLEGHPLNGTVVKGSDLVGINAVTFRRNDETGAMEVVRTARNVKAANLLADGSTILNADLH